LKIVLGISCYNIIVEKVLNNPTIEMVFFVIGTKISDEFIVKGLVQCKNIAQNPSLEFIADPICIYKISRFIEQLNLDIIGIVHSHSAPPFPSKKDIEGMKKWPIVWIIVSSISSSMEAWLLDQEKNRLLEVDIDVRDNECSYIDLSK